MSTTILCLIRELLLCIMCNCVQRVKCCTQNKSMGSVAATFSSLQKIHCHSFLYITVEGVSCNYDVFPFRSWVSKFLWQSCYSVIVFPVIVGWFAGLMWESKSNGLNYCKIIIVNTQFTNVFSGRII